MRWSTTRKFVVVFAAVGAMALLHVACANKVVFGVRNQNKQQSKKRNSNKLLSSRVLFHDLCAERSNEEDGDKDLDHHQWFAESKQQPPKADTNGDGEEEHTLDLDNDDDGSANAAPEDGDSSLTNPAAEDIDVVGVKAHKKSNAVGDPDGEGSSDDDDDDLSDWDLDDEFLEEDVPILEQVQVEVEFVEQDEENNNDQDSDAGEQEKGRSKNGGVGVRFGQRFKKNRNNSKRSKIEQHLLQAWQPHVYLSSQDHQEKYWDYLIEHARTLDADSKTRLDRRTLYAGLLLEWMPPHGGNGSSSSNSNKKTHRKFLEKAISQQLQAALSLATQPSWRKSFPRPSAIQLYDNDESSASTHHCTLAMQETIAMALAHSLGAGMVVLDDNVLASIRQRLLQNGYSEEDVKPAALIQSVLALAKQGALRSVKGASIADCMRADLSSGLDDPFDERATLSCEEMNRWEDESSGPSTADSSDREEIPLVIFLRVQRSNSLLRSRSAVDALLAECNSRDSRNLLVMGKGIDATTVEIPQEPENAREPQNENPVGSPWFGFPQQNQNRPGAPDPAGSRRFNIFLARTVDRNGKPGIVGAVAPPEAGNLFPQMMAMQARMQMQQEDEDSPAKADMEHWAQIMQQQTQSNAGSAVPPPQFFNASLSGADGQQNVPPPSPEVILKTLEHAMWELLDRLAQLNEDGMSSPDVPPELQKAFAQVLRNDGLRRGIAENLARAAPSLTDPRCQGVVLSIFVPPPTQHMNPGKLAGNSPAAQQNKQPMGNWFQKMLNHQEEDDRNKEPTEENRRNSRQKRARTMAAAAAVMAAQDAKDNKESKSDRNLAKLEAVCRPLLVKTPSDPVRAKSWEAWISRERGAVIFRQNRKVLNEELEKHYLSLQEHTGTRGAGSALRQMLSVRPIAEEMGDVIKCAIELEAAKSQRQHESPDEMHENEMGLDVDITLSQLLISDDGLVATEEVLDTSKRMKNGARFLHPSSLESALSCVCRISPSPAGGLSLSTTPATHRSREEITALAQDKHERALVSQVVSPQDIGVTYDMIGGLTDVKELLRQSITYPLKFPHLYSEGIAREAVKGVLLFGPPGTGKTMLAKAVATEGGASFLSVDASSVENKWLGESEKNAKAVFTLARRLAPCVIFVDEVDSLLSSREGSSDDSAHGTLTSVKTTMMSEWDGLNSGTNGAGEAGSDRVIVIGSTNRPFDLDEAVLRRFPRRILVDLPDLETRTEILEVTLAENRLDTAVNLTSIAERLEGYTGSDIKEVCREAVVQISHEQAKLLDQGFVNTREDVTEGSLQRLRPVTMEDFEKALSKLKRSVSEKGRELARVWEWNDEYGEIKKENKNHLPHLANMYL